MRRRKTKIVCTIGPASSSRKMLKKLILAGMNVARLNFSHGTHEEHRKVFERVRSLAETLKKPVAVMQDLQGPKIRTGKIKKGSLELKVGEEFVITSRRILGESGIVSTSYGGIIKDLDKGHSILMDDGLMELKVLRKDKTNLYCRVVTGGMLRESKGINLPGVKTRIPSLTKKDKKDLRFGIEMGIDYVAISFVRSVKDVKTLKKELKRLGAAVPVIAKIEKPQALEELDEILGACEGIMVARGDLGVELSPEKVPMAQKLMIRKANQQRKLVITATQMLESMTDHPIPTRAEASDVANAILDGTDAVMLSGETSVGHYPVKSVQMMERIARQAEADFSPEKHFYEKASSFPDAISESACLAAENLGLKSIVAFSQSGFTAKLISKYRPSVPIIALTHDEGVQRQLTLHWGVDPILMPLLESTDQMIDAVEDLLLNQKLLRKNDRIALLGGIPLEARGKTNMMKLHVVGELRVE